VSAAVNAPGQLKPNDGPSILKTVEERPNTLYSAQNHSLRTYRETQIRTASQGSLIVMLYDETLRRIRLAVGLIQNGATSDIEAIGQHLTKAQDIVTELMVSLDFERGGDIARNLFSIYMFANRQLMQANLKKEAEALEKVHTLLAELRSAWVEVATKGEPETAAGATGVNIAG